MARKSWIIGEVVSGTYLTYLGRVGRTKQGAAIGRFRCRCGTIKEIAEGNVRPQGAISCGCWRIAQVRERKPSYKHGFATKSSGRTYYVFCDMIRRCTNPKDAGYGGGYPYGKGVSFPEEWYAPVVGMETALKNFIRFHGKQLPGTTLGRYLDSGHYGWILVNGKRIRNSEWQTIAEQMAERAGKVAMIAWHERRAMGKDLLWRWRKKFATKLELEAVA